MIIFHCPSYPIRQIILLTPIIDGIGVPVSTDTSFYFDIIVKDKIVGSLKATQTNKGSEKHYQSSTIIKTRVIKNIQVNYRNDVIFDHGFMKKADVNITLNEKPHAKTHTRWRAVEYQVEKNGMSPVVLKDSINYATILLYFEEPIKIKSCFSEQDGSFNTIVPLGNHTCKKNQFKREREYIPL